MHLVSVHEVHPYSSIDTAQLERNPVFILLDRLDNHIIDNLSIAVHTFAKRTLVSLSVDEILLLRYVNFSTNFRDLPL